MEEEAWCSTLKGSIYLQKQPICAKISEWYKHLISATFLLLHMAVTCTMLPHFAKNVDFLTNRHISGKIAKTG